MDLVLAPTSLAATAPTAARAAPTAPAPPPKPSEPAPFTRMTRFFVLSNNPYIMFKLGITTRVLFHLFHDR